MMNDNYLSGLFFPAVAGLFFFMKKTPVTEITHIEPVPVYSADPSGLTGVARYLECKNALLKNDIEAELPESENIISLSGVDKYIQKRDQHPITGVTKYALRVALAEKKEKLNTVSCNETSVAKYLKNQKSLPVVTGVAKYLKQQESLPKASKVAKYVARQALAEKMIKDSVIRIEETGVAKYLKQQESLPKASRVARYLAKQAVLNQKAKKQVNTISVTGVSKYLLQQDSLPKASRVARYIARQAANTNQTKLETIVAIETGVDRYVRNRS